MDSQTIAKENMIFKVLSGSYSYGTSTLSSDKDIRGAFIAPPTNTFGLFPIEFVKEDNSDVIKNSITCISQIDTHYCSITEFVKQLVNGAHNWIELLYVPSHCVIYSKREFYEPLLSNRDMFLTQHMIHKSMGFTNGMIRRSINNVKKEEVNLDTLRKQAMHGVRVSRMMVELLKTGEFHVWRGDRDRQELLDIRSGKISHEWAWDQCSDNISTIEDLIKDTTLPDHANREKANEILMEIIFSYWYHIGII